MITISLTYLYGKNELLWDFREKKIHKIVIAVYFGVIFWKEKETLINMYLSENVWGFICPQTSTQTKATTIITMMKQTTAAAAATTTFSFSSSSRKCGQHTCQSVSVYEVENFICHSTICLSHNQKHKYSSFCFHFYRENCFRLLISNCSSLQASCHFIRL